MDTLRTMSASQLREAYNAFKKEYEQACALGLNLDISRGKPNGSQLDLSNDMLSCLTAQDIKNAGADYRNYGILDGIPEAKELFAPILGVNHEEMIVCGNSSLTIMYDCMMRAMVFGVGEGKTPWGKQGKIKFLCPSPGYDRHFAITEQFGLEMISIPMTEQGPDMDMVEFLVCSDPSVKGIWCVPKYSNPQGITYSDETVRRFAALKPAADDFRIFWDNAYCIHDLYDEGDELLNIMDACKKQGNEDIVYMFFSTSKISHAGSGVAVFAASGANIAWQKKLLTVQAISYDKVNQLRHVKFFKNSEGLKAQMKKHADILRPKFEIILDAFDRELASLGCVYYPRPRGGYFISLDVYKGCAKRCVELCKQAGVVLTAAGSTYPYKNDPEDKNIRVAPSYIDVEDLEKACKVLCASVKLACAEKFCEETK